MGIAHRTRNIVAMALATVALNSGQVASQLITDAESMEACEVLRLGDRLDVAEWLAFVGAPSMMLDAMGRVYARGGQDAAITVLDADGGFVRTIGGKGEGPGEFVFIGAMGFVGDTLWLQNWPVLYTSFFDSAGVHLETETDHGPPSTDPRTWRTSRREIAMAPRVADRKRMIAELQKVEDPLAGAFRRASERAAVGARAARGSGDYPLLARGDLNLYSLFVERAMTLVKPPA